MLEKNFVTELYKNLTVEVLSSDNSENLQFDALPDLCIGIGARLENSIFANHERARPGMEKRAEEIMRLFYDEDNKKNVKIKKEMILKWMRLKQFPMPR